MIRRELIIGLLTVAGIAVAGCSSGADHPESQPDRSPTAAMSANVDGWKGELQGEKTSGAKPAPYHFDGHGANVSAAAFGKRWPLTVPSGRVNCIGTGAVWVVFTADDGTRYAVNGLARGHMADQGFKDIAAIWAKNPAVPGTKKNIGPLIDVCAPLMN